MREPFLDSVRCIAFDFCGTLADLRPSSVEILASYLQTRFGLSVECELLASALLRVTAEMPYSSLAIRSEPERRAYFIAFNARVLGQLGRDEKDGEDLYAWFRGHDRHWMLKPEAPALLTALRARGYRVVLASNFDASLAQLLERAGSAALFDHLYVSAALGVEKPDLAFYRHLQETLACPASEIAMVGDDLALDVYPALALGMRPVHLLTEAEGHPGIQPGSAAGYMQVSALNELLQLFPGGAGASRQGPGATPHRVKP